MGGTYFGVNLPKQLHCILVFIICSADTAAGWKVVFHHHIIKLNHNLPPIVFSDNNSGMYYIM